MAHHIVMLPFPAQGHLIPFLALAKLISRRKPTYTITLVSTPLNIQTLKQTLPTTSNIHLKSLPFSSSDHGLPPNSESTDSLPHHHIIRLMQATESLHPHFDHLITSIATNDGHPPLAIISDVFFGWTVAIAKSHNTFHAVFTTCGAYGTAAYISLWLNLPHLRDDIDLSSSNHFSVPGFPETFQLQPSQLSHYMKASDGTDPWCVFLRRHIQLSKQSNAMLCNTVEAVERAGLGLLRGSMGIPVWAIGPLSAERSNSSRVGKEKLGIELETCMNWLDSHLPSSVVYISFGSQNTISCSQMLELAAGLEASEKPFIWVVRPPVGLELNESFSDEWLPEGFRERMKGLLVEQWAPQFEILSHPSTGGFLSHCGWNSVMESLICGVPVIGWPLGSDQFYNSKVLEEEVGVCVELARGVVYDLRREEVERVIGMVIGGGRGEEMRERAGRVGKVMKDAARDDGEEKGSSVMAVEEFLETVISQRTI